MKRFIGIAVAVVWLAASAGATPEPEAPPAARTSSGSGTSGPGAQMRIAGRLVHRRHGAGFRTAELARPQGDAVTPAG